MTKAERLKENMERRIVGKGTLIDHVILALLSGGHVLLEDVPGVGKTSLARALSDSVSLSFARIQCTPDTMPGDITGISLYDKKTESFRVMPGPVVNQIVLADEINRATPKTQSALLEAMEEQRVTIDRTTVEIPEPFMVIGTQNPQEMAGTYPLPEAQLDRFLMKLSVGYPERSAAAEMADRFLSGALHEKTEAVLTSDDILEMKEGAKRVAVAASLTEYAVRLVEETRNRRELSCGASPRALLQLLRCAQAAAFYRDRDYCIPEDIAEAARLTLPHRLILTADSKMNRVTADAVLRQILSQTSVPG